MIVCVFPFVLFFNHVNESNKTIISHNFKIFSTFKGLILLYDA